MKQKVIKIVISSILVLALLFLVGFVLSKVRDNVLYSDEGEILSVCYSALDGDLNTDSWGISDEEKQMVCTYIENNTVDDNTKIELLSNVTEFNNYVAELKDYNDRLAYYNITENDRGISDWQDYILDSFKHDNAMDSIYDETSLDKTNDLVIEKGNKYYIRYSDVHFGLNNEMIIRHKGFTKTLSKQDFLKPTYKDRENSASYVIDRRSNFFETGYILASANSINTYLIIRKSLFGVKSFYFGSRVDYMSI